MCAHAHTQLCDKLISDRQQVAGCVCVLQQPVQYSVSL